MYVRYRNRNNFKPSEEIFKSIEFNYSILVKRIRELSFLNDGVNIKMSDERTEKNDVFANLGGLIGYGHISIR